MSLNGESYRIYQGQVLPELLQDVLIPIRNRMCLQHDGAPAHFSIYLNATFEAQ